MSVVYAVSPNLVSPLNHALEELNVLLAPVSFTPVRVFDSVRMDRISVGNQEKCGRKTVLVEDRNGLFELTSQSVVEGEGNKCWFVHLSCDQSLRFVLLASPWVRGFSMHFMRL